MRVLIVNAILYTNEDKIVKRVKSVRDCMIVDLCNAFVNEGHDVTLIAAEEYKPLDDESFPFNIVWMKSYYKRIFTANKIPYNRGIKKFLKENEFDLIISSEVFSLDTLMVVKTCPEKLIIWQEMAFHQRMAKQLASKIWHSFIVKRLYKGVRIVPRTDNAKAFISQYCDRVSDKVIQHGINLEKFVYESNKEKYFIVSSQLIERKRIDRIIESFGEFSRKNKEFKLYIAGDGDQREVLQNLTKELGLEEKIIFLGKLKHKQLIEYLQKAMAMLIYTRKDNSMISIAESIAVGTPVITTSIPDNAKYIDVYQTGRVNDNWGNDDLEDVVKNNSAYVENCKAYRKKLDNRYNVKLFIEEIYKE